MKYKVLGAKAGQSSARTPVINPDSAQSKTYMRILDAISEGEIVDLSDLQKRIYLNETPLMSEDGSLNFQDVTVDFRTGTNDQTYIQGFPDVSSETDVNVELKYNTPYVRAFNNLDLDAIDVRLRWGALRTQNASNGDVTGVTIDYALDVQTDGGTWTEVIKTRISDKTSDRYERSHRIDLPRARTGWQIRVRRLTANSTSDLVSDKMYVAAVSEVIDAKLSYPNVALLGLRFNAETFGGSVPKIAIKAKGVLVRVPSNYNAATRQYTGIWNGTFIEAYTDNPAWHFYNICIEKRYGLGHHIDSSMIEKWDCYKLAQYCDQLVPDGKGGQEPRFTLNVYQQNQEDAWTFLQRIAGVFRAFIYWDGTSIRLEADVPQDVEFVYTQANVIDGEFNLSGTRKRDRHTIAYVNWDNPANLYKTEQVVVRDDEMIANYGINPLTIDAWGVTSEGQAQRAGLAALKSEKLETQVITFKVGLDGYCPRPGRVIGVADYLYAGRMNGGRVSAVSSDRKSITLDRDDVAARAGDRLVINGEDGKAQNRIVESITGRVITVTYAFDANSIAAQNVWAIDAQDLAVRKFRVISITQDEKHQFTISALEYNPAKYDAIDFGAIIDDRPISIINPTVQKPVESITLSTENMVQQGLTVASMLINFPQVEGAVKYQVEWRKDDGSWIKLPITGSNSVEVQGIYAGNYQARVTAINAFDLASLPTYSNITALKGKQGLPPKLAFIRATGVLFGMKLDWGFPAGALDTAYTEIQVSPDGKSNIASLGSFAYPTTTHTIQGLQPNLKQFYRGRLIDRIGNVGAWSDWANGTTTSNANDVLDLLDGQISNSQLDQDLREKIDKIATVDGDIADIIKAVNNLEDGYTQERSERISGDQQNLNQLNAYKLSNDQAVAGVVSNVKVLTDDQKAISSKVDGVYAQVNPQMAGSITDMAGDSTQYAGVWSEMSARIENDLAQSMRTDSVVAQINDNDAIYKSQIKAVADANSALVTKTDTLQTTVDGNTAKIQTQQTSINGIYTQEFIKTDVNGHVSGRGSMNDGKTSTMIFNYDAVYFGAPSGVTGIPDKPLMVLQANPVTLPNGTVIPRGMYLENANIGYLHASRIYADSLSAISADLGTIKVKEGNIEDLAVSTLKIKDNAVTVPVGSMNNNSITVPQIFTPSGITREENIKYIADRIGDLSVVSIERAGGNCQALGSVVLNNVRVSTRNGNQLPTNVASDLYCVICLYLNSDLIAYYNVGKGSVQNDVMVFSGTYNFPVYVDSSRSGVMKYSIRVGFATTNSYQAYTQGGDVLSSSISLLELKK